MSKRATIFLIVAGTILLVVLATYSLPPQRICEVIDSHHQNCAAYSLPLFIAIEAGKFVELHNGMITALAGVAVAFFTATLWWSTKRLWIAGERQLSHSRETARQQLRAYVAMRRVRVRDIAPGKIPVASWEAWNVGQTPAINFRQRNQAFWGPSVSEMSDVKVRFNRPLSRISSLNLGPGTSTKGHAKMLGGPLPAEAYEKIVKGEMVLGFFGIATYRDIFKRRHFTTFKVMLLPDSIEGERGMLAACDKGNYVS